MARSTTWRYRKGTQEASDPRSAWREVDFDDSTWPKGVLPLGYGETVTTTLSDMNGSYSTVYLRKTFTVTGMDVDMRLRVNVDYDDGFIVWINGERVLDQDEPDAEPLYNSLASDSHESGIFEEHEIGEDPEDYLEVGENVIAVQLFNESVGSSDAKIDIELVSFSRVRDTTFSTDRGFFDSAFALTIATATAGATIRYTTNGTEPSPTYGTVYTGPISIGKTTCLRAMACKGGYESTDVDTQTYIFVNDVITQSEMDSNVVNRSPYNGTIKNDLKAIPTLSIAIKHSDMFGTIYPDSASGQVKPEKPMSLELIYPNGEHEGFQIDCAVRPHSHYFPKRALKAVFKRPYGPTKLRYPIFETAVIGADTAVDSFDQIILRSGCNRNICGFMQEDQRHTTYTRDEWLRSTQALMSGVGSHGMFAHLYINGQYWGLYNPAERPDESFTSSYFGGEKEDWFAINHGGDVTETAGADDRWDYLHNTVVPKDMTVWANYELLMEYLNVKQFCDYILLASYTGLGDWPRNNWYAGNRNNPPEPAMYFAWDAESSWWYSYQWNGTLNVWTTTRRSNDGAWIHPALLSQTDTTSKLWQSADNQPDFRLLFADRLYKHGFNDGVLTEANAKARWNSLCSYVEQPVNAEYARWGDEKTPQMWTNFSHVAEGPVNLFHRDGYWYSARDHVLNQMTGNVAQMVAAAQSKGCYPGINPPAFLQHGGAIASGFRLTMSNPNAATTIYYTVDGSDPRVPRGSRLSGASRYTGPVTLSRTTHVKARVWKNNNTWSAVHEATYNFTAHYSNIRITEIMYNPLGGAEFEFVEIRNTGSSTRGLSDMQLKGLKYAFPPGTELGSGAMAVLVADEATFTARYPNVKTSVAHFGVYRGRLDNGGEKVALLDCEGRTVTAVRYNDKDPWPEEADGEGYSLVFDGTGDQDDPALWRASNLIGGSPGYEDGEPYRVVINEALTHTDLPQKDALELYNAGQTSVDIGGWYLSDTLTDYKKFRIPTGTVLAAGGYKVYDEDDFNHTPGDPSCFLLDSHGDEIYLTRWDASGNMLYLEEVRFGGGANGVAFGRHMRTDGETDFVAQGSPATTLGGANAYPAVGPVVINELMYHSAAAGGLEFVELYNPGDADVPLYDLANPANTWKLAGGVDYVFAQGKSIGAREYALVVPTNEAAFRAQYPGVPSGVQVFGPYAGRLSNAGESVKLWRPDTPDPEGIPWILVDRVQYNDNSPWPEIADGDGPSLERQDPAAYGNDPANWAASHANGGTPGAANSGVLVPKTAGWRYHDRGEDLGTAWRAASYDDSAWDDGNAPLGYAHEEIDTTVDYGEDPNAKHITTYFRRMFTLAADPDNVTDLTLYARYDDGFVAYLNGQEVERASLPTGTISYGTTATSHEPAGFETFDITSDKSKLVKGLNVLAVEVHQSGGSSSDLFMDIELKHTATVGNPPAAPANLAASAASTTRINLTWTDASNNETGFKLDRRQSGTQVWERVATLGANISTYSDSGLAAGTLYYYMVKAYNGDGNSPYSNVAAATTQEGPPAAPSSLVATAQSTTRIDLRWTDNSGNETGFKIERSPNGSSGWAQIGTTGADITTYSDSGLTPATACYYRVRAANAMGDSGYSNVGNATTPAVYVQFAASASSGGEAVSPATLSVTLSGSSPLAVSVNYAATGGSATGGGTDYTLAGGTLNFSPGQTAKTISVTIVDDGAEESAETIVVTLSSPSNAALGSRTTHTYTIADNDRLFEAYNDLCWSNGQTAANITLLTRGQTGFLVDYNNGQTTPVRLTINDGGGGPYPEQGVPPASGTDAYGVFNGKVDCAGLVSYGTDLTLQVDYLDPELRYELVLFGNRGVSTYTDRLTTYTISGVDGFSNESTSGAGPADAATVICNGWNTQNGYVARYTNIDPGADGAFSVTLSDSATRFYLNALMLKAARPEPTVPVLFTAYNDLLWAGGQLANNITRYTGWEINGLTTSGPLVDYATGTNLGVQVSVTTAAAWGSSFPTQGANPAAGTDGYSVFNGKVDCVGNAANDDITIAFTGLEPAWDYTIVIFGNRHNATYTDRISDFVISDVAGFDNASSSGAQVLSTGGQADDTTRYCTGWNTDNGYVAKFTHVKPGADGDMTVTVSGVNRYANAFMLSAQAGSGTEGAIKVAKGAVWRYRKGTAEASTPGSAWRNTGFDDSGWASGNAPIGYGGLSYGTTLSDMEDSYSSVFLRRSFTLANGAAVRQLNIEIDHDDGFLAWLNGEEIARVCVEGAPGEFVPFDALATENTNATWSTALTGDDLPDLLLTNVLAVQMFNRDLSSGDLLFDAELSVVEDSPFSAAEDSDQDTIPDDWETAELGGTGYDPEDDKDGDGFSNVEEYIAGTDPDDAAKHFAVRVECLAAQLVVSFDTVQASGTGYAGLTRFYTLEERVDLNGSGAWLDLAGCAQIEGTGQTVSYTNGAPAGTTYYRARVWLE
ncbi:MAG: lamin tail domain-containing protein [Kiritimatiellae bacterium]|nr:lamin tail domain-containing protein [Kiritimatiellia bacterium]